MTNISEGDVVTFTEYEETQLTGRMRIRQRLENMTVEKVVQAGQPMGRDDVETLYGSEVDDTTYAVLRAARVDRLFLKSDDDEIFCVQLVPEFVKTGMQKLEIGMRAAPPMQEAPSYLDFINSFGA